MNEDYVRGPEFERFVSTLQRQMSDGFDRTSREIAEVKRDLAARVTTLDTTSQEHGEAIAALNERTVKSRRTAGSWGGGVGAFVAGALIAAYKYLSGGQ